nr:hypothetical protein [Desulforadius tongensis]
MLVGKSDKKGEVEFTIADADLFNKDVKEFTVFYNIVEESRFKLFRNNKFELILVHVTEDWMRQAKIDISKYSGQLAVKITWNVQCDTLSVKGSGEEQYTTVKAVQIDN